jgi:hypothetical protein
VQQTNTQAPSPAAKHPPLFRRRIIVTSSSSSADDGDILHHSSDHNGSDSAPDDDELEDQTADAQPPIVISDSDDMYVPGVVQTNLRRPTSAQRVAPRPSQSRERKTPSTRETRIQRRRIEPQAEESSGQVDSSACSESDEDAQQLYRDAIRGVRSARQARSQVRAATQHCMVCSKFAAFVAKFL